jgi:hypothetical protein
MAFPPKKPAMGAKKPSNFLFDDEGEEGSMEEGGEDMDSLMGQDIGGKPGSEILGEQSELENTLSGLGYQVDPEKLKQIEAILGAPGMAGEEAMESPEEEKAELGMPGATPKAGGVMPSGVKASDFKL